MVAYEPHCLFCDESPSLETYTCHCNNEEWMDRYRSLGINLIAENLNHIIRDSYEAYELSSPLGILQYKGIPNITGEEDVNDTVGGTELLNFPLFSDENPLHVLIKNEGSNPSGCFKDRETISCWLHAKSKNRMKAVIYSSGNAAASAAWLCQEKGIDLVTFVPGDTYDEKIDFIRDYGADVIKLGNDRTVFEEGYSLYAQLAASGFFMQKGFDDWSVRNPFRIEGDKSIAVEIVKQLRTSEVKVDVPDFMIIPTANGSCLVGVWKGFKELKRASIIDKLPKMVSVGMKKGSPIYKAISKDISDKPAIRTLEYLDEEDEEIGSIILAEEGYDSIEAASAVRESNGIAMELKSEDIKEVYDSLIHENKLLMNRHDLLPEPAAALSIAAITQLVEIHDIDRDACIVSLVTGHGMKSKEMLDLLIDDDREVKETVHPIIQRRKEKMPEKSTDRGHLYQAEVNIKDIKEAFFKLLETS